MKKSKKTLLACGYSDVIRWGKQNGKQRFSVKDAVFF